MKFATLCKESPWDQVCVRCVSGGLVERPFPQFVKMKPVFHGELEILKTPGNGIPVMEICQEVMQTAQENDVFFWARILKGVGDLKKISTSNMEMQILKFAQLFFGLALVQNFLTMVPFLHFRMRMYILWLSMFKVCDLSFDFVGDYIKRLHESQKGLWTLDF